MSSPIIFIGMHRSGTSLLGRLLEQLGLFVGEKKDENNEALFFLELNAWLMSQCGARWDQPEPISDLWKEASKTVLSSSKSYVRELMNSPRAARYLGFRRYLRYRSIPELSVPWGWKDPRNTYTLPFWLEFFPNARVIFIERHGVDVAQSLCVRASRSVDTTTKRYEQFKPISWVYPKRGGFSDSPRCLSLEGGFSLWESYQYQALDQLENFPENRIFRVRYEELLSDPFYTLKGAASFCGLSVLDERIRMVTRTVNPDRACSYRKNSELLKFAEAQEDRLRLWGYTP
ncbi:sulfotransferase [Chromohalobacter sp. 11-W]|uniref:sulfotransferase n=1 Tax=Chromohalobacter sp. 11-W TaxID=2994061 RepID=UPI002469346D|nr:sulfotransferase [Chromohalobacter sp. 11-W]